MVDDYETSWLISATGPLPAVDDSIGYTVVGTNDVVGVFAHAVVYVEYATNGRCRHPVVRPLRGLIGNWIFAYTSYDRFRIAHRDDDEIDYSKIRGADLISSLPDRAGIWVDYGFGEAHRVIMAQATPTEAIPAQSESNTNHGTRRGEHGRAHHGRAGIGPERLHR